MTNRDTDMAVAVYLAGCFETPNVGVLKKEFAKYQGCTQKSCVDLLKAHKLLAACWFLVRTATIRPINKKEGLAMLKEKVRWTWADNPLAQGVGEIHRHKKFRRWTKDFLDCVWRYKRHELNSIRAANEQIRYEVRLVARFRTAYERCEFRTTQGWKSEHVFDVSHRTRRISVDSEPYHSYEKNADWKTTNSRHHFTLDLEAWDYRIQEKGLAVIDGMLTLWLGKKKCGVYEAKWVRQGRGTKLVLEYGFVAVVDGLAAHGATAPAALRRAKKRSSDPKYVQAKALIDKALSVLSIHRMVTLEDSVAAGNCPSGTKDWAEKHLNGKTEVSVGEIKTALLNNDDRLPMVLRVLRSLR
tara:strand:+ start:1118 stop:2185 length:1068 start_codon:yes stop_codon:yes gene_type:complete